MSDILVHDVRVFIFSHIDKWKDWYNLMRTSSFFLSASLDPKVKKRKYELTHFLLSLIRSDYDMKGYSQSIAENPTITHEGLIRAGFVSSIEHFLEFNPNAKLKDLRSISINVTYEMTKNICKNSVLDFDELCECIDEYPFPIKHVFQNRGISPSKVILMIRGVTFPYRAAFYNYTMDNLYNTVDGLRRNPNLTMDDVLKLAPHTDDEFLVISSKKNMITCDELPISTFCLIDGLIKSRKIGWNDVRRMSRCHISTMLINIEKMLTRDIPIPDFIDTVEYLGGNKVQLLSIFLSHLDIVPGDLLILLPLIHRGWFLEEAICESNLHPLVILEVASTLDIKLNILYFSGNRQISDAFVEKYDIYRFNPQLLSSNLGISIDFILRNLNCSWYGNLVSGRSDVTMKHVIDNPNFPWNYPILSSNHAITYDDIFFNSKLPWDKSQIARRK